MEASVCSLHLVFWQIHGLELVFKIIFDGSFSARIQNSACLIASECLRNEHRIQLQCLHYGAFNILNLILKATDIKNKRRLASLTSGALFNVISALVKGLYLTVKRRFIDIDGIHFIVHLLQSETDPTFRKKLIAVLDDLALYDKELGGPETLLMVEQDKNILKGKTSSHISLKRSPEMTEEEKEAEQEPMRIADHSEYLHITKKKLFASSFLKDFETQLLNLDEFLKNNDEDSRSTYFKLVKIVILYGLVHKLELPISLQVV